LYLASQVNSETAVELSNYENISLFFSSLTSSFVKHLSSRALRFIVYHFYSLAVVFN